MKKPMFVTTNTTSPLGMFFPHFYSIKTQKVITDTGKLNMKALAKAIEEANKETKQFLKEGENE